MPGLAVKVRVEASYTPAAVAQLLPPAVGRITSGMLPAAEEAL